MRKTIVIWMLLGLLTACSNNGQDSELRMKYAEAAINYIEPFSEAFDDFNIKSLVYLEDSDYMYYLIEYEGVYTIEIDFLDINIGDLMVSSSLCRYSINTGNGSCLNGSDVDGNFEIASSYQLLFLEKEEHYYYVFSDNEMEELTTN